MLTATVDIIVRVTEGELVCGAPELSVTDLFVDSRDVAPGCAFVALAGEHTDGHDHAVEAFSRGARLVIVTRPSEQLSEIAEAARVHGGAVVRVADALEAVQSIASWHRDRIRGVVIGVTGSTGKTTTKDFLNAVLAKDGSVVSTQGNRNNELGVPLTVLRAGSTTSVLVVEMGMRGVGQIARLCEIARPTMGLVTNVGTSHIEVVGSVEAIVEAKGELVAAVAEGGVVFLNGDDAATEQLMRRTGARVVRYGLDTACEVTARDIVIDDAGLVSFTLVGKGCEQPVSLAVPGRHNVYNALAAAAVGLELGISCADISDALAGARLTGMRMELVNAASGLTVINDAYNANPTSMRAAVDTLSAMRATGKRVAVLGDMAELGSLTELAHFQLGEYVARSGIEGLVTVGPRARRIAEGALAEGMAPDTVRPCEHPGEASEVLDDLVTTADVVLVKASRVMGLEIVVEGLVNPRV